MNIKEIIGKIMTALDEVTSSSLVANQADYIDKIYPLIDSVQFEIATIVKPIKKYVEVASEALRMDVQADCFEMLKVYNSNMKSVYFVSYNNKIIVLDEGATDGTYTHYFNKYPNKIDNTTPDDYELEISKECQEALIFGVCAGLTINDEPELYDTYSDKYNVMLANITSRMQSNATGTIVGGLRL